MWSIPSVILSAVLNTKNSTYTWSYYQKHQ